MSFEVQTPNPSLVQHYVLAALIQGATITTAARAGKVHRTTVHYWCRTQPHFRLALEHARQMHAESVRDELRQISRAALSTLRELMDDRRTPDTVRLRAALRVIDFTQSPPAQPASADGVTHAQLEAACKLIGEASLLAALPGGVSSLSSPGQNPPLENQHLPPNSSPGC